jgi:hypothetical protein
MELTNPLVRIETYDQIGLWATATKRRFVLQWMIKVPLFCTVMAVTCADVCQFGRVFGFKEFLIGIYMNLLQGWEVWVGKSIGLMIVAVLLVYLEYPEK